MVIPQSVPKNATTEDAALIQVLLASSGASSQHPQVTVSVPSFSGSASARNCLPYGLLRTDSSLEILQSGLKTFLFQLAIWGRWVGG